MHADLITRGGGVFSKLMNALQNISRIKPDKVYLDISQDPRIKIKDNPFDYIFEQYKKRAVRVLCRPAALDIDLFHSRQLSPLRQAASKLIFKDEILSIVEGYKSKLKIHNTLGVHLRLTDMNTDHGEKYGFNTFEDYIEEIEKIKNCDNIFVASDNKESIRKLVNIYGNKIKYVPGMIRVSKERTGHKKLKQFRANNLNSKQAWEEAFIECLLLASCKYMIYRPSNVCNAAMVFSNTLKNTFRIKKGPLKNG